MNYSSLPKYSSIEVNNTNMPTSNFSRKKQPEKLKKPD